MPRWTKIILKVAGVLFAIVLIGWIAFAAYVHTHKKELLASITTQLNDDLSGSLTIGKMEPALIQGFPGISVTLTNILVRDSLWKQHKHDVLSAEEAYVSVDALSVLSGNPTIKNITINNGQLYFFTDSLGYSNTNIFKKKSPTEKEGGIRKKRINRINLLNVRLVNENQQRSKLFDFNIAFFNGRIRYNNKGWKGNGDFSALVNSLAFNTDRGSFLKNKKVQGSMEMNFDDETQNLTVPMQDIKIDETDFELGGMFSLDKKNTDFALDIKTSSITLKEASSILLPKVSAKLKRYQLDKPISASASIRGRLKSGVDPLINATW